MPESWLFRKAGLLTALVGCSVLISATHAEEPAIRPNARPSIASPSSQTRTGASPLDRLKSRSAEERWRDLNRNAPLPRENSIPVSAPQQSPTERLHEVAPLPAENDLPRERPVESVAAAQPLTPEQMRYPDPARNPSQLKKLSAIQPYFDYEPDPDVLARDRCLNLCPRPDERFCPDCEKKGEGQQGCPECPEEVSLRTGPYTTRVFPHSTYNWEAPDIFIYPLYFEDMTLERYGQTRNWVTQPLASTAKFSAQLLGLPYQMAIDPIWCKRSTLGYYRPGYCAPFLRYQIPWNTEAAAAMLGVYTGGAFIFN